MKSWGVFLSIFLTTSICLKAQVDTTSIAVKDLSEIRFNQGQISDPIRLIQGRVPGILSSRFDGDPNTPFDFVVRGFNTLQGARQPLIIIDGVIGLSMDAIDPQDIAEIEVLKGFDAAYYGVLGNSGVIDIKTKSAATPSGKVNVYYHSQYQRVTPDNPLELLSASEFIREGGFDYGANTNWFDELTESSWGMSQHLALSAKTDKATYRGSVTLRERPGIIVGHERNSLNTSFRMTQNLFNDRVALSMGLNHVNREIGNIPTQAFRYAISYNPTAPVFDGNETFAGYFQNENNFDFFNPIALRDQLFNDEEQSFTQYHTGLNWKITPELSWENRLSQSFLRQEELSYVSRFSNYSSGARESGIARRQLNQTTVTTLESVLNYSRTIGNFRLSARAGAMNQVNQQEGFLVMVNNFQLDGFGVDNLFAGIDREDFNSEVSSSKSKEELRSFFGMINFGGDLFDISASLRNDGHSGFGENSRYTSFLGVRGEVHLQELIALPSGVSMTLFGGFSQVGNLPPAPYLSGGLFETSRFRRNEEIDINYNIITASNPDLATERRNTTEIGLNFSLMRGKLQGSMNYFNQTFEDLLFSSPVPRLTSPIPGFQQWLNLGEVSNAGFEYTLNHQFTIGAFKVSHSLVGAFYQKPTLDKLGNENISFDVIYPPSPFRNTIPLAVGGNMGDFVGLTSWFINDDGNFVFRDFNNDGRLDVQDEGPIGNGLPSAQLGWNALIQWKSMDLNLFFRGVYGHDILNTYNLHYGGRDRSSNTWNSIVVDGPRIEDFPQYSSYYMEKGNFTRLDNMTIGFSPRLKVEAIKSLRVYLTMTNPLLFTDYTGVSPEVRFQRAGSHLLTGIEDRNIHFPTKSFTLGVQLGL
ncbi:MAG: TonB-dependent receptor plug domain-containing protein [Cytophagales bacterium]|nr:TonB-dependent receptor plug domain-containing protein [Cytophagales bacterium]